MFLFFINLRSFILSVTYLSFAQSYLRVNCLDFYFFFKLFSYGLLFNYKQLIDITVCDFISLGSRRFFMYYGLVNLVSFNRIFLELFCEESVVSLSSIYFSANWLEREVWDMFGIFFIGHTDLRRLLTDYGFIGYPLRKNFPLSGFFEVRYDDTVKAVVYDSIFLAQEFRCFSFINPWL